jgi:hypothetical protein
VLAVCVRAMRMVCALLVVTCIVLMALCCVALLHLCLWRGPGVRHKPGV